MNYMTCNTCRRIVVVNNTGICLACQAGFSNAPQQDQFNRFDDRYPERWTHDDTEALDEEIQ